MFGSIGITEIILLAGIALVFVGPEKFPELAKIVARTIRDIRGYVQQTQDEIKKELKPVQNELKDLTRFEPKKYLETLMDDPDHHTDPSEDFSDDDYNVEPHPDDLDVASAEPAETPEDSTPPEGTRTYGQGADPSDLDREMEHDSAE